MAILGTTLADGAMHASEYIWVKTSGIIYFSTRGFEIRVEWNESASAVYPVVRPINQAELPWFKVLGKEKINYFGRYYTAAATMRLICKTMLGEYLSKETAELNVRYVMEHTSRDSLNSFLNQESDIHMLRYSAIF
jgi:hypothetical protein